VDRAEWSEDGTHRIQTRAISRVWCEGCSDRTGFMPTGMPPRPRQPGLDGRLLAEVPRFSHVMPGTVAYPPRDEHEEFANTLMHAAGVVLSVAGGAALLSSCAHYPPRDRLHAPHDPPSFEKQCRDVRQSRLPSEAGPAMGDLIGQRSRRGCDKPALANESAAAGGDTRRTPVPQPPPAQAWRAQARH
jgi:hypothetical protein